MATCSPLVETAPNFSAAAAGRMLADLTAISETLIVVREPTGYESEETWSITALGRDGTRWHGQGGSLVTLLVDALRREDAYKRRCGRCGEAKPLGAFSTNTPNSHTLQHDRFCKECRMVLARRHRLKVKKLRIRHDEAALLGKVAQLPAGAVPSEAECEAVDQRYRADRQRERQQQRRARQKAARAAAPPASEEIA